MGRAGQTIGPDDLRRAFVHFNGADLKRGRAYFQSGRVRSVDPGFESGGYVLYSSLVMGSAPAPYESYLTFDARRNLVSAECTCPLGGDCKHCVATLQTLLGRALDRGLPPGRVTEPRQPLAEARIDYATEAWLLSLSEAGGSVQRPEGPSRPLLFILSFATSVYGASQLRLGLFRASGEPGEAPGNARLVSSVDVDWTRDPGVTPADHALVLRMGQFSMGYVVLHDAGGARTLADVVATGRAYLDIGSSPLPLVAAAPREGTLAFEDGPAATQRPAVRLSDGAEVAGGGSHVRLLPLRPPFYVDESTGATGPVNVPGVPDHMVASWLSGAAVLPRDAAAVTKRFETLGLSPALPRPRVRALRPVTGHPAIVVRLESEPRRAPRGANETLAYAPPRPWVRVFFDYDGARVDPTRPEETYAVGEELLEVHRQPEEESRLLAQLEGAGLVSAQRALAGQQPPAGLALTLPKVSPFLLAPRVDALASEEVRIERAPGFEHDALVADGMELDLDDLPETSGTASDLAISLGLRVGDETFDALPLVLAALREQAPDEGESLVVRLADGRAVLVPATRLLPLRQLLEELLGERDPNRLPRTRALALDPLVLARSPESLMKLRAALASPRRRAVPKTLRAKLREYQREGFAWLMARREAHLGAILADDMGLGKTVQTLALLLAEDRGGVPSLVVCPKSVLGTWEAEAARFAPSLAVAVHHGPDRASRADALASADVVLTTYALLARDTDLFAKRRFATVVLDEAQTIKTAGSALTHAACALRADFRLALSGTPMENHLGELWSVMRFALPEVLGDSRSFGRAFRRPIERDGREAPRTALKARLAPFVLRRRKEMVASELPPKTMVVERIELEDRQRDVYEAVRAAMDARVRQALALRGLAKSHIVVLDALLKLRQAVCDPRLLAVGTAKKAGSAKLVALVEKLVELVAEGRRVLVFSQFVTMLDLVQEELRREEIPFLVLTGQSQDRMSLVEAFQRGDAPVFLLSLKAGGTGLNLTAADVVIHYDPWWNPAAEAQATDRAHRIGQDKPVLVYKLVGKDTIEEKILLLQEKKQALFTSVMDDGAGVAKKLTADDVAFLFAR